MRSKLGESNDFTKYVRLSPWLVSKVYEIYTIFYSSVAFESLITFYETFYCASDVRLDADPTILVRRDKIFGMCVTRGCNFNTIPRRPKSRGYYTGTRGQLVFELNFKAKFGNR